MKCEKCGSKTRTSNSRNPEFDKWHKGSKIPKIHYDICKNGNFTYRLLICKKCDHSFTTIEMTINYVVNEIKNNIKEDVINEIKSTIECI